MRNEKRDEILRDNDYYMIQIAESEVYSWVSEAINLLPSDCAESFRMFIEGYDIKEIAKKLDKPLSTIYSQRTKAISIIKNSNYKDKLFLFPFIL